LAALAVGVAGTVTGFTGVNQASATLAGFKAGNIMSDAVMSAANTMSVDQIQAFLNSKNACNKAVSSGNSSGIPVVVTSASSAYLSTNSSITYQITGGVPGTNKGTFLCLRNSTFDGQSAAQIIYTVSQANQINPQVLLVLLQKEQSLITDTSPNSNQYKIATGFGCPDTAACNTAYYGFSNQLTNAAKLFHTVLTGGWSNYPAYTTVYVQYNPNASCGGSNVYISNRATSALYRYTPYQPNAAVLANPPGSVVACGAYGNSNFYSYFTDWFGSTQTPTVYFPVTDPILAAYTDAGGPTGDLGYPTANQAVIGKNGLWQQFENGRIYYRSDLGAFAIIGPISTAYAGMGGTTSCLGYPKGKQTPVAAGMTQQFEKGSAYWTSATGAYGVCGAMLTAYTAKGGPTGTLGFPTSNSYATAIDGATAECQDFKDGTLCLPATGDPVTTKSPPACHFLDLLSTNTFVPDICWMAANKITTGMAATTYAPKGDVTREAMAAFMYRLAGVSYDPSSKPSFTDVSSDKNSKSYNQFYSEIEWMNAESITHGMTATTYAPKSPVTREAMAAFLYRLSGSPSYDPPTKPTFSDVTQDNNQFYTEIEWMNAMGITTGMPNGTYAPKDPVTREAMAAFMWRMSNQQLYCTTYTNGIGCPT